MASVHRHKQAMKICKKCSKKVKVHLTCFKCRNIYHAKCFLRVPTVYVNEKGHIFCCQNLTLKFNNLESKLEIPDNENGKYNEEGACGSGDGLENSKPEQQEFKKGLENSRFEQGAAKYEKAEAIYDADFEKKKKLEEVNRDIVDFVCSYCKLNFFEEQSYRQHIKFCERIHLRQSKMQNTTAKFDNIHKCNICSYITTRINSLKEHLTIHSCEKPFKCTYKLCKCMQSLDTSQVKHCDCEMCEYRTASKKSLRRHIIYKHGNIKKTYKCDHCAYATYTKSVLRRHALIHRREKPFKCDSCEFETVHEKSLSWHILYLHSNMEKQFKCNDCEFSTHTKGNLQAHLNIHMTKTRV